MARRKILIAEFMDAPAVALLAQSHELLYDPDLVDQPERLIREAATADALIVRNRTQVRGDLLAALGQCKVIGRLGVGLDNIDTAACAARQIAVIPANGANALSVAEYVVTTSLVLLRGAYFSSAAVAQGAWPRAALSQGREAAGQTLGLIGFGSIGQTTARLAQGLGLHVQACDAALAPDAPVFAATGVASVSLDTLLASSDVVSLHVPLLDSTRGLMNAARIAAMKPGAVLINTSRGHIVDTAALVTALQAGHLAGAALDVFDTEPLPASAALQSCPNLLLTPHISGVTQQANQRVSWMIANEVLKALQ